MRVAPATPNNISILVVFTLPSDRSIAAAGNTASVVFGLVDAAKTAAIIGDGLADSTGEGLCDGEATVAEMAAVLPDDADGAIAAVELVVGSAVGLAVDFSVGFTVGLGVGITVGFVVGD